MPEPVRVMLCDDSALVRRLLAGLLEIDDGVRIVATAGDGQAALATIAALPEEARPQVVLLDLEMPVMDGMTALPLLLRQAPAPAVIVASALSQRGAAASMAALRAGAADYIPKPTAAGGGLLDPAFGIELRAKVRGYARLARRPAGPAPLRPAQLQAPPAGAVPPRAIAIGASTGGPQALAALVLALRRPPPVPLLVVQHMPQGFTGMLADHLDRIAMDHGGPACAEAIADEPLRPGRLYVAPAGRHLLVRESAVGDLFATLSDAPPEHHCRPAVDPLLRSLGTACGAATMAVILTGMGQDGLLGCRAIAAAGGQVLAQDADSSVVWGMPGAIARAGLAQALAPPADLAARIASACRGRSFVTAGARGA